VRLGRTSSPRAYGCLNTFKPVLLLASRRQQPGQPSQSCPEPAQVRSAGCFLLQS